MKKSIKVILAGVTFFVVSLVGGILCNAHIFYFLVLTGLSVALMGTFSYFYHDYNNESVRNRWIARLLFAAFVGVVFVLMVVVPSCQLSQLSASEQARREATRCSIEAIRIGITVFDTGQKRLPTSLEELTIETTNSDAIMSRSMLLDSWGHPFRYTKLSRSTFEIRSAGPDGRFGTRDDLTN